MRERASGREQRQSTDNYCSKRILGTQLMEPWLDSKGYLLGAQIPEPNAWICIPAQPLTSCVILSSLTFLCLIFFIWVVSEWMYENYYKWPSRQQVLRAWTIIIIVITQNEKPARQGNTAPENAFVSMQLDAFSFWTNSHSNYILIHIHCRTMQRMLLLGSVRAFEMCTSEAHICFLSGIHSSSGWTEEITNSRTCTV